MKDVKTIFITGAGGFLGSKLLAAFVNKGYQVQVLSSQKESIKSRYGDKVKVYSLTDFQSNQVEWSGVDYLIHCAFATQSNRKSLAESLAFSQTIFLEAARAGVSKVVNFSTRSVYGHDANLTTDENTAVDPINEYGFAKYASELLLECVAKQTKLEYVNIRLSSLLGVGYDIRLVNKFVKTAIETKEINIVGGKQNFSFMDVRDAVDATIQLIESESHCWNKTYNLGSNRQYSILELAELVAKELKQACGVEIKINVEEKDIQLSAGMNSDAFYRAMVWQPKYLIESTIQDIVQHESVRTT